MERCEIIIKIKPFYPDFELPFHLVPLYQEGPYHVILLSNFLTGLL